MTTKKEARERAALILAARPDANAERLRPIPIDERCWCDHLKSEHGDKKAKGHGSCLVNECDCWKYTWKSFVYAKTPEVQP